MATTKYSFTGKVKWAQILKPNKFDKFSLQFYPDDATRKAIKETGTRAGIKEDEDGFYYTFRRNPVDQYGGGPVVVTGNNGGLIGNGSTVKIEIETYDYSNEFGEGKGTRLNSVEVLELVEYKKDGPSDVAGNPPVSTIPIGAGKPVPAVGKKTGARAF